MRILLNIGNTHTSAVLCRDGALEGTVEQLSTENLLAGGTLELMARHPELPCFAACVVPAARRWLQQSRPADSVRFIAAADAPRPDFSRVDASTLGQDRIANAVGALSVHAAPVIVLDCGTALTTEVIDADGVFLGGVIAPGRRALAAALHANTAQLPEVCPPETPTAALAANTTDALRGGISIGILGLAQKLIDESRRELQTPNCPVLVAGGDARYFLEHLPLSNLDAAPAHLTLLGLATLEPNL
ncbi:MAG: type III pantothenate kinase [Verrucomicrobiota bacterium]